MTLIPFALDLTLKNQKLLRFDGSKINLIANNFEYFQEAMDVYFELAKVRQNIEYEKLAFQLSELSKSTTLIQSITANKNAPEQSGSYQKQIDALQGSISEIETIIYNEQKSGTPDAAIIKQKQLELINLYKAYDTITVKKINTINPKSSVPNKVEIEHIQRSLTTDQTVLSFFHGKDKIYAFLIKKNHFITRTIPLNANIREELHVFRTSIQELEEDKSSLMEFQKLGFSIYQKVLAPFEPYLTEKLIIIPDGPLRSIPFEALMDSSGIAPLEASFQNLPFLVKKYAIAYHYSASLLIELNQLQISNSPKSSKKILAFSPNFLPSTPNSKSTRTSGYVNSLGPLFYNKMEVQSIGKIYPTKIFDGQSASKKNFKKEANKYEIIHLATHAVINDEDPERSFISFSQTGDSLNLANIIYVDEIYHLPIQAKLVVLSACQTGDGKQYEGEGMMSLARAFMYSGANCLLTTLWEINDAQSAYLIRSYYTFLKEGVPTEVALQKAKLIQLKEYSGHPKNWAPFIQIGNSQKI